MADADKSAIVGNAIKIINQRFTEWQPVEGKANQHLWSLLGQIYEASSAIDGDKAAKEALLAEVRKIGELRKSNRWDPNRKTSAELLLSILLGLSADTKGTKSQWLSAVRAAKAQNVEPTEAAYVKWIKGVGGIIAARRASKGKDAGGQQLLGEFSLSKFNESIEDRTQSFEKIKFSIDPVTELYEGFSVVLVRRGSDASGKWNNKLDIVAKVSESGLVEKVAKAVEQGRVSNPAPSDLDLLEAELLVKLNRFTLKQADIINKKPSFIEWKAFQSAVKKIKSTPILAHRFFDGQPASRGTVDPVAKIFSFDVLNADYKEYDPGRFIGNAKPLALVPYIVNKGDNTKIAQRFYEYESNLIELRSKSRITELGIVQKNGYFVDT